ncbi:hypothetical protein D3C85_1092620 [compost metagenome]
MRAVDQPGLVAVAPAHAREGRHAVIETVFGSRDHGIALYVAVAGAELIDAGIGCHGNDGAAEPEHGRRAARERFLAVIRVNRSAQSAAAIVQASGQELALSGLAVQRGGSVAEGAIDARAPLVAGAIAPAGVYRRAQLPVGLPIHPERGVGRVARPLGHEVDGAPHRAAGGHAAEQGVRAFQHLDPLHEFQRGAAHGRQPVHAVDRHIVLVDVKPSNAKVLVGVSARRREPDRRVIGHDIRERARLLVLDKLGGIARDVERGVHHVLVPHQPQSRALRHLPSRIGRRQLLRHRARGDRDGLQRRGRRLGLRPRAANRQNKRKRNYRTDPSGARNNRQPSISSQDPPPIA